MDLCKELGQGLASQSLESPYRDFGYLVEDFVIAFSFALFVTFLITPGPMATALWTNVQF